MSLKNLRWAIVLLACVTAWTISAWLWKIAQARVDPTTAQFEKTFVVLLAVLPTLCLLGIIAEQTSKNRWGKLLFWSSIGMMTLLFLIGGPLRWFNAPSTFLLWVGLVIHGFED